MRELVVIDLDGTLIAYDSFNKLIKKNIYKYPFLIILSIGRKISLLSREKFAEQAHNLLRKKILNETKINELVKSICFDIISERLNIALSWKKKGALILLLSASPNDYVSVLAKRLQFDIGLGSDWKDNKYIHMYGKTKRDYINTNFPKNLWRYAYAISDSNSDFLLLKMFEEGEMIY